MRAYRVQSPTTAAILRRLSEGAATNAQLAQATGVPGADLVPYLKYLRKRGQVARVDGASGSGRPATYGLRA